MGTTEQFSLRWNNFHSNLSSGFQALFEENEMVDVTLAVDGKFLQAHKIVLSICSPYFKQLFKINPCKHPIVILKDVGHEHMKHILEFMYMGEVSVLRENLTDFLKTAEILQVKGLTGDESNDNSPKNQEKNDCDNEREAAEARYYLGLTDSAIDRHYSPYSQNMTPSEQSTNLRIYQNQNAKRHSKNTHSNFVHKKPKTDNNNQSCSKLPAVISTKNADLESTQKDIKVAEEEPEYTDISNIKSEKSILDLDPSDSIQISAEKLATFTGDNFADQGKFQNETKHCIKPVYTCSNCPKKFTRRDHLRTHEKNIHGEDAGPFACVMCSQIYKNTESLRKHISKFHLAIQLA